MKSNMSIRNDEACMYSLLYLNKVDQGSVGGQPTRSSCARIADYIKSDEYSNVDQLIVDDDLWRKFKTNIGKSEHITNAATKELLRDYLMKNKCYRTEEMERVEEEGPQSKPAQSDESGIRRPRSSSMPFLSVRSSTSSSVASNRTQQRSSSMSLLSQCSSSTDFVNRARVLHRVSARSTNLHALGQMSSNTHSSGGLHRVSASSANLQVLGRTSVSEDNLFSRVQGIRRGATNGGHNAVWTISSRGNSRRNAANLQVLGRTSVSEDNLFSRVQGIRRGATNGGHNAVWTISSRGNSRRNAVANPSRALRRASASSSDLLALGSKAA